MTRYLIETPHRCNLFLLSRNIPQYLQTNVHYRMYSRLISIQKIILACLLRYRFRKGVLYTADQLVITPQFTGDCSLKKKKKVREKHKFISMKISVVISLQLTYILDIHPPAG